MLVQGLGPKAGPSRESRRCQPPIRPLSSSMSRGRLSVSVQWSLLRLRVPSVEALAFGLRWWAGLEGIGISTRDECAGGLPRGEGADWMTGLKPVV